jgi:hypothetical protein
MSGLASASLRRRTPSNSNLTLLFILVVGVALQAAWWMIRRR